MEFLTVSLFGHRIIDDRGVERKLTPILRDLIQSKSHVAFLVGRNGEFDELAARIIKALQREIGKEKSDIVLVLPYVMNNIEFYEKYYDNIIIPDEVEIVHPKSAITKRNRWMIDHSDMVVAYVEHAYGGAYTAMCYAERQGKDIVRLNGE